MVTPQLNEQLYGLFYDVFKRVGIALNIDQLNSLRGTTDKITNAIQSEIKDGMKRVVAITISEMKSLEERVNGQTKVTETGDNKGTSDTVIPLGDDNERTS